MRQVPNQPVVFPVRTSEITHKCKYMFSDLCDVTQSDPTDSKREDDWIAWTWIEAQRVNGTVPEMVARFPMTKVRVTSQLMTYDYFHILAGYWLYFDVLCHC